MDTNANLTSSSGGGGESDISVTVSAAMATTNNPTTTTTTTTTTLFDCLVAWVSKFEFVPQHDHRELTVNDFKDGVLIAKCLNSIDPDYFSEEWISKIKSDTNENWRLKLLNLKKILQTLTDYYSEVLNYSLADFEKLNLNLIVETNNNTSSKEVTDQLSHLLQLVLGCAVNCERKSDFIQNIMEMNESSQHMLMTAIQELMNKDPNASTSNNSILKSSLASLSSSEDFGYQLKKSMAEVNRLSEMKEDLEDKCKMLEKKVDELSEDKMALLAEIDLIKVKLTERESLARNESNNDLSKQLKMQQKLDSTLEELYKLESEKEKFRIQYETAKAEQTSLMEKNIELSKMVQENQSLKDEIDVLKHNSDRVEKLESIIASYKIKLEEMSDLKKQMRGLEESNSSYLEKILLLEEEVKKVTTYKSQIDMYKKQIQELHEKMLGDEMKMKKLEYEYKNMEETCNSLTNEKNSLMWSNNNNTRSHSGSSTRDTRSPTLDEPDSAVILRSSSPKSILNQSMDDVFSGIELVNIPSELREKVMRLCHENKLLKSRQGEMTDEKLALLEAKFEDEKQRNMDLQTRLNEANRQRIELEYHMNNSMSRHHQTTGTSGVMSMSNSFNSLSQLSIMDTSGMMMENSETRRRNELSALAELENLCKSLKAENESLVTTLKEERNNKLKELQNCEAKYHGYLEKAQLVIKTLDPMKLNQAADPNNQTDPGEIELLRRQLTERDKQVKDLMVENQKLKENHDKETKLIAASWYKLGEGLNRKAQDERTASIGNSSFLSQQRQLPSSNSNNMISSSSLTGGGSGGNNSQVPTSVYHNSSFYHNRGGNSRHYNSNNNNNSPSNNNNSRNMVRNVGSASIL